MYRKDLGYSLEENPNRNRQCLLVNPMLPYAHSHPRRSGPSRACSHPFPTRSGATVSGTLTLDLFPYFLAG